MQPISQERVDFIHARLKVLDYSIKELSQRKAYYQQSLGASHEQALQAMAALKAEQLNLYVEAVVIGRLIDAEVALVKAS